MKRTPGPSSVAARVSRVRLGSTTLALALVSGPVLALVAGAMTEWYVDIDAPGCVTGTGTRANPFCNIMDAVQAASDGDRIHIAPGTYEENLILDKDLTLKGTEGDEVTIVDAPGGRVVRPTSGTTTVLEGLTVTGGLSDRGAGIFIGDFANPAVLTLQSSTVRGNSSQTSFSTVYGGGIYNGNGHVTLEGTLVSGNRASVGVRYGAIGGGIFSRKGTLILRNSTVADNSIQGNYGWVSGSGVATYSQCTLSVESCTIARNKTFSYPAAGLQANGPGSVRNTIAWGNRSQTGPGPFAGIQGFNLTVDFSNVQLGWSGSGANNISLGPAFLDARNGDFSLAFVSPCIDAGDPSTLPGGLDQSGNPRALDGDRDRTMVIDMGAYEFANLRLEVTGDATPGGTITVMTTGWPNWTSILAVGFATSEISVPPLGSVFLSPVGQFALGKIPNTTQFTIPPTISVPFDVVLQELGLGPPLASGRVPGNFSNPVYLTIE